MVAAGWTLLALAAQQPQVVAEVDRSEVPMGEPVTLTVTIETVGAGPVEVTDPTLEGFEVVSAVELPVRVTVADGVPSRVAVRRLTLRPTRTGDLRVGPVVVRQAGRSAASAPITVRVTGGGTAVPGGVPAAVLEMVARAPPPPLEADEVTLTVRPSRDTVVVGQQVDLIITAWFPRAVKSRLRSPPTLTGPAVEGAWVYRQAAPRGDEVARQVRGRWYDVYVGHAVIFPITAGPVEIGPATVAYTLPLSFSFLSRELRHEVESGRSSVYASSPADGAPPAGYQGAAAARLTLALEVPGGQLELGKALTVRATLSGRGNVALWPEPRIAWPAGLRVYPEEAELHFDSEEGVVGGWRAFRYLIVADSTGTHRVAPVRYPFFDFEAGAYAVAQAPGVDLVTPGAGATSLPTRVARRPLAEPRVPAADRWMRSLQPGVWVALAVLVPFGAVATRQRRRWGAWRQRRGRGPATLQELEREFRNAVSRLIGGAERLEGHALEDALRAAGLEPPIAAHAVRIRERLRHALFGPSGLGDPEELAAEVREVLRALTGGADGAARGTARALLVLTVLAVPAALPAQSAERLYEAGAVRAAADSFVARARQEPLVAAHWYNLGNAYFALDEPARAHVAWHRARQLAPRDPRVREALALVPAPDRWSRRLTWVAPLRPAELWALAGLLWVVAWGCYLLRAPRRIMLGIVFASILLAAGGVGLAWRDQRPVAVVIGDTARLRPAPVGPLSTGRRLDPATAVVIEDAWGRFFLVRRLDERGWVLRDELARL